MMRSLGKLAGGGVVVAVSILLLYEVLGTSRGREYQQNNQRGNTIIKEHSRPQRVIFAVGDLHGDLEGTKRVLRAIGVMGESTGAWTGGDSVLVQMGDLVDRGDYSMQVLDFFMDFADQAKKKGGAIRFVLGNHELMNVLGDWRYVSVRDIQQFGGSAKRKAAFSAEGKYGKWIRSEMKAIIVEDRTLFVHAGLMPVVAKLGVDHANELINMELRQAAGDVPNRKSKKAPDYSWLLGINGTLWTRDIAYGDCKSVRETLDILNLDRMVVGHTVQNEVTEACGGSLWLIDVGISYAYFSNTGAIQIRDGVVSSINGK
ncbi:Metallo-dependent phosphatase [Pelomyxa schiedti]|nr:Metallo-dependent phosphatase [Pelomyxa schiedti]